jgi:hypothetical protein
MKKKRSKGIHKNTESSLLLEEYALQFSEYVRQ